MTLHNEARKLLVEAYYNKEPVKELVKAFHISRYTLYHLLERAKRIGTTDLQTVHNGRKASLCKEDLERITAAIHAQPDITLNEIKNRLSLPVSISTISRAVNKVGFTYKKKTMHASEQERPRCAGKAEAMERKSGKN